MVSAPGNNILYWDANTGSLLQQLRPNLAHGPAAGRPARTLPVAYTTWQAWRSLVPETTLYDQPYGSPRDRFVTSFMRRIHARTRAQERPLLAAPGEVDRTLHPKARVFALCEGGEARAYARGYLREHEAVNDEAGGRPVAIFYDRESDIAMAHRRELDGRRLSFEPAEGGGFEDEQTGTRWDVLGRATVGKLAGRALEPVPFSFDKVFWFGWKRHHPDTALLKLPGECGEPGETPRLGPA